MKSVSQPAAADCDPGWPAIRWHAGRPGPIGFVLVYPDEGSAEAVLGQFHAAGWSGMRGGDRCSFMIDGLYAWRWERVDNVIIQFNLTPSSGTPSEHGQIARILAALEGFEP